MEQFIGCDAHKKFSVFVAVNEKGHAGEALRVTHDRQLYREFLARLPAHSEIAVEATGSYGWVVDEMERLGHRPKLCNPYEAKRRIGSEHPIRCRKCQADMNTITAFCGELVGQEIVGHPDP